MSFNSFTTLQLPDPAPLMQVIRHELMEHDLPFSQDDSGKIDSPSEYGEVSYIPTGGAIRIEIASNNADHLYILRESIEAHLEPIEAMLTAPISWSGNKHRGAHPPHFREIRVLESKQISANFFRLRFGAEDLARYEKGGLHFRLLLPGNDAAPVWPTVSDTGSTIWPEGGDKLHMPVYTFRRINAAEGWFEADIFHHGNGRTCDWAAEAKGRVAGMLGPGGGDIPQADNLLLLGDETALPAIARMSEARSDIAPRIVVSVADPDDLNAYPLLQVESIPFDEFLNGLDTYLTAHPFVWFGGRKADARALKEALGARGYDRPNMQVQAYW